jgi:hypothetical protein
MVCEALIEALPHQEQEAVERRNNFAATITT